MISFGADRPRRRPNLTPMIDVVFLLLVFFMLVSRFGSDRVVPLAGPGAGGSYSGPPRLVHLTSDRLSLNGQAISAENLPQALATLTTSPSDAIILRADGTADLQALVRLTDLLSAAGFTRLVLVE